MPGITKRFRWGDSVNDNLHLFATGELNAARRKSKKLIKDFTDPELEGEGYRSATFVFDVFTHVFRLAYQYDAEEWVIEVDLDELDPMKRGGKRGKSTSAAHSPRRRRGGPPGGGSNARREARAAAAYRRPSSSHLMASVISALGNMARSTASLNDPPAAPSVSALARLASGNATEGDARGTIRELSLQ